MFYDAELEFLQICFKKCHIQTHIITRDTPIDQCIDIVFADYFDTSLFRSILEEYVFSAEHKTVYKATDIFHYGRYLFLLLPGDEKRYLIIGPYVSEKYESGRILEQAEKLGFSPYAASLAESYYTNLPILPEANQLFVMLDTFVEHIWGNADYAMVDINQELQDGSILIRQPPDTTDSGTSMWKIKMMEERYAYENELMDAVSKGQSHKAELLFAKFSITSFEKRLSDPVRNLKNYCIIMNTLLRKAAENGGVHPIYLDTVSSDYAKKIEQLTDATVVLKFMQDMFRTYCRLVKKHSMKNYSPPVQKTITYIDSDLTANFSLSYLAALQRVSPSYLSNLFRQETGQTITEYINQKRMKLAMHLLTTTKLQIQTVSQHCGIMDVHYFSKLFKKHTGSTPKEYREKR